MYCLWERQRDYIPMRSLIAPLPSVNWRVLRWRRATDSLWVELFALNGWWCLNKGSNTPIPFNHHVYTQPYHFRSIPLFPTHSSDDHGRKQTIRNSHSSPTVAFKPNSLLLKQNGCHLLVLSTLYTPLYHHSFSTLSQYSFNLPNHSHFNSVWYASLSTDHCTCSPFQSLLVRLFCR